MGILDTLKLSRLKTGLAKTRNAFVSKVERLIFAKGTVDDDFVAQLEEILIAADVGVDTTQRILTAIKERTAIERYRNPDELQKLVRDSMAEILDYTETKPGSLPGVTPDPKPRVIMVVGVNGVGKTTTIGKLAYNYRAAGNLVVIGAADTFRAAANEQLDIWAKRAGVTVIQQVQGSDPAAVAFDTVKSAQSRGADVVIIDTAGRLHTKVNLMEELKKIKRVMQKCIPSAPHEVLLVLDASTGQNAIQQARQFNAAVGITGLVVTKLDGTAKGGMIFAVSEALKIPVRYIGVGEQLEDLQPFNATSFLDVLFEKEAV